MPGHNLTRDEARARAGIVTVDSYDVDLDLTVSPTTFGSRTTVRFDAAAGASTFIDLIAPRVREVTLNGRVLDPAEVVADSRIRLDGLSEHNELLVAADCAYMTTGEGLHRFVDPVDGEVYLYSQFEVADSRRVFAVFEQPDLKATFQFRVTAPAHWTVVSNYPVAQGPARVANGRNRHGGRDEGTATWTFERTPRIASYVTAVVAGPYAGVHGSLTSSDGRTVPLGVYCRASLAEHLDAEAILDVTRAGFAFYEEKFARAYPFAKYDQVFVPEFNAGAMENVGAVTFREQYVFRSQVPEATIERRTVTILHELAHMWFGDLVTMRWWDDLWLNESFAEYMSTLATSRATRWHTAWTTFLLLEKSWAYNQDQLPSTHPIVADIRDLEDVEVNFDGITYAKGASVLKQLVAWVGEDAFFAGVQRYFATHAWGNTELRDLLTELEHTSGRDLGSWSALWLEQAGVTLLRPEVTSQADADGTPVVTAFAVVQEVPDEHPVLRPHRLAVSGYDLVGVDGTTRLDRTVHVVTDVDPVDSPTPGRTEITELVGRRRPDLVLVNDLDLTYAKTRLDPVSMATATAHLGAFTDSLPRALVWSAAWDATRDGETPARSFVDLVLTNVHHETDSSVVQGLLRQLSTAIDHYVAPEHRGDTEVAAADRLWELAQAAPAGSDLRLQLVRAFAARAATAAQLDVVAALLDGRRVLDGLVVDTDLRWDLLTGLVAGGRADAAEIDAELAADPTASGQRAAASARAAIPTAQAKEAAWAAVVDRDDLPNALQTATIAGFGRVHDRGLLRPFVTRYLDVLEQVWAQRTNEMAQNIVLGLYPTLLADDPDTRLVERTQEWLAGHRDAAPALRRLLAEELDAVRRSLVAQQVDRTRP